MKNRLKQWMTGLAVCTATVFFMGNTVYAGDINEQEQRIINYYNKTFEYDGKTYVATEAAKQTAYAQLAADDTDLTAAQVDTLIAQANASVAEGIAEGYLVEVPSESTGENGANNSTDGTGTDNQTGNTSDGTENNSQTGNAAGGMANNNTAGGTENDNSVSGTGNSNTPDGNENQTGNGNTSNGIENDNSANGAETENQTGNGNTSNGIENETESGNTSNGVGNDTSANGTGNGNEAGTGNPADKAGSNGSTNQSNGTKEEENKDVYNKEAIGNADRESDIKPQEENKDFSANQENNAEEESPLEIEENKKIDIGELIDSLQNEGTDNVKIFLQDGTVTHGVAGIAQSIMQEKPVAIEQYKSAKTTMLQTDGTIIYEAELPVKNTGYQTGNFIWIPVVLIGGMGIVSILVWKFRRKKWCWIMLSGGLTAVVLFAAAIGASGLIEKYVADFKMIWVAGAPGYQYTQVEWNDTQDKEIQEIKYPKLGELYGKIQCEAIGMESPVYYGDDETILEIGVGTYSGGCIPGENGTILLGGHDTTFFETLGEAEKGDIISIETVYGTCRYKVTETAIAKVTDTDAYPLQNQKEQLILYTCYPFGETGQMREERFFVYADRVIPSESGE